MVKYVIQGTGEVGKTGVQAPVFVEINSTTNDISFTLDKEQALQLQEQVAATWIEKHLDEAQYGVTLSVELVDVGVVANPGSPASLDLSGATLQQHPLIPGTNVQVNGVMADPAPVVSPTTVPAVDATPALVVPAPVVTPDVVPSPTIDEQTSVTSPAVVTSPATATSPALDTTEDSKTAPSTLPAVSAISE